MWIIHIKRQTPLDYNQSQKPKFGVWSLTIRVLTISLNDVAFASSILTAKWHNQWISPKNLYRHRKYSLAPVTTLHLHYCVVYYYFDHQYLSYFFVMWSRFWKLYVTNYDCDVQHSFALNRNFGVKMIFDLKIAQNNYPTIPWRAMVVLRLENHHVSLEYTAFFWIPTKTGRIIKNKQTLLWTKLFWTELSCNEVRDFNQRLS